MAIFYISNRKLTLPQRIFKVFCVWHLRYFNEYNANLQIFHMLECIRESGNLPHVQTKFTDIIFYSEAWITK